MTFGEPTEIIGHSRLILHVEAPESDDLDLFAALFKTGRDGEVVGFPYYAQFEDGPVAVGWLRASHREPDPELSTEFLTVLAHRRALPVPRGQVIEAEIEILPSGTRFEAGEGLLLIVQGTDIKRYPKPLIYARHENTVNAGPHRIHTGPAHPSRIVSRSSRQATPAADRGAFVVADTTACMPCSTIPSEGVALGPVTADPRSYGI